jgi:hypothetical protein
VYSIEVRYCVVLSSKGTFRKGYYKTGSSAYVKLHRGMVLQLGSAGNIIVLVDRTLLLRILSLVCSDLVTLSTVVDV